MMKRTCKLLFILILPAILSGCIAAAVTATATGAAVAVDKRTTGTVIEDQSIELKAKQSLAKHEEIKDNSHINIVSYNTVVLVTGEATTEAIRDQIIETVRDVPKVSHVHNEISIAAPNSLMARSSDSLITSKVKTRLLAAKDVDGYNIKVVTDKGAVYLMGLISREEAERATDVVRRTGGVQKVVKLFQYTD
ncbi:MAG: BON domain-containing protein [Gammaproteobacteria bacterium]